MEDSLRKGHVGLVVALVAIVLAMRLERPAAAADTASSDWSAVTLTDQAGYQAPDAASPDDGSQDAIALPQDSFALPTITPRPATNPNLWSSLSGNYQGPNCSLGNCGPAPGTCLSCFNNGPVSTWYTRIDYFHWTERLHTRNLLDEQGPLFTLGYTRQWGDMRVRAELFGGVVQYQGAAQFGNGTSTPLNSHTNYYGGRGEWDFFCNMRNHPWIQLFIGMGIRSWNRDLPSATVNGIFVQGYNETWFTFYPYIGFETRRDPTRVWEFYGRTRIGVTAWNFNYASLAPGVMLYPRPGATALLEEGIRWGSFTVTGWAEVFGWARSGSHNGYLQPQSTMLTAGVKAGWSY